MVNFYIHDFQVTNRCNDMEYNNQSHYPIIVNLAISMAPYNDEWQCRLMFKIKVWT
jgi:hypothetical protein